MTCNICYTLYFAKFRKLLFHLPLEISKDANWNFGLMQHVVPENIHTPHPPNLEFSIRLYNTSFNFLVLQNPQLALSLQRNSNLLCGGLECGYFLELHIAITCLPSRLSLSETSGTLECKLSTHLSNRLK